MDPILGGALINAGSNALQSIGQTALSKLGYNRDVKMWERQNEYNKPANQMKRLKEAGLNPNLVYGTGTVAGNTSSQLPKYNSPTAQFKSPIDIDLMDKLGQFAGIKNQDANTNQARELANLTREKSITEGLNQLIAKQQARKLGLFNDNYSKYQLASLESQTKLNSQKILESVQNTRYKKFLGNFAKKGRALSPDPIKSTFGRVLDSLEESISNPKKIFKPRYGKTPPTKGNTSTNLYKRYPY